LTDKNFVKTTGYGALHVDVRIPDTSTCSRNQLMDVFKTTLENASQTQLYESIAFPIESVKGWLSLYFCQALAEASVGFLSNRKSALQVVKLCSNQNTIHHNTNTVVETLLNSLGKSTIS